jgi:hypothetical protein
VAKKKQVKELTPELQEKKILCENSTEEFIRYVHPKSLLGNVHVDLLRWWDKPESSTHQLVLLPREHRKSTMVGYRIAQTLTKDPTKRILLISSTSNLAVKQLKFIKDIFTSDRYRAIWPDMVHRDEFKREKWTEREISLDHPLRKEWSIREPSIFTAGLTTNITGLHCDIAVLDDVVTESNAYTEDGRSKVRDQYGYLSSVETVDGREWTVGTRYHPKDLYADLMAMEIEQHDDLGNIINTQPLYEKYEEQVESNGDGTGQFLWPRQQSSEGKWFGFDADLLSRKRSQYTNKLHFRAQYYNDPHDVDSSPIQRSLFQYYEPGHIMQRDGRVFFKGERLNIAAAIDFAYSLGKKSDFSSIVVVGVDGKQNFYILEIDRFKTEKPSEYFDRILKLHTKWGFTKIRAEVTAAQKAIVANLKESYIRPRGLALSIDEYHPARFAGAKEERIMSCLEPKYANHQMWHYVGGYCQPLEEELIFHNPPHDDIKDALAMAVDFVTPPMNYFNMKKSNTNGLQYNARFGGVS